jgi:AcrR family transcriptional regulator
MGRPRLISDEQILAATRKAVLREGPGVSLDVVASELHVTQPALLKRFGSRRALVLAALRPAPTPPWLEAVQALPDDRPLCDQLAGLFKQVAAFFEDEIPCMTALRESGVTLKEILQGDLSGPRTGIHALIHFIERLKAKGLAADVDAESSALAMLGALQFRAFYTHVVALAPTRKSRDSYAHDLAQLFERSLIGPGETRRGQRKATRP